MKKVLSEGLTNKGPEEDEDIELPESVEDPIPDYIVKPCGKEAEQSK